MTDFNTYQLGFHMPHLLLRPSPQAAGPNNEDSIADVSFLNLANATGEVFPHLIYRGHISLVICGWSDLQWTGYTFNRNNNVDLNLEEIDKVRKCLYSEHGFDFATPSQSAQTRDARRYWLRLIAHRSQYVLRQWQYLVQTIEEGI